MGELLVSYAWLPSPDGSFHKPSDTKVSELLDGFETKSIEAKYIAQQLGFKSGQEEELIEHLPEDLREIYEGIRQSDPETIENIRKILSESRDRMLGQRTWDAEPRPSGDAGTENPEESVGFSRRLFDAQTHQPSIASEKPVQLPIVGPKTKESATTDTEQSLRDGRSGLPTSRTVTWWQPSLVSQALEEKFRNMTTGDYSKRCQVCGDTFQQRSGDLQTYVVHLVKPSSYRLSNHFGNLISLCGWHYTLMSFGQWSLFDQKTGNPVENPERLNELIMSAEKRIDENGNDYFAIPIRFFNIYPKWQSAPILVLDQELRFTGPHWSYLCELFNQ